ncbi:MAG: bifunctional 5,10-methylenetetrahydrofolate dehydrogenase/5,10-methenyltetrahydrofolate cyclohydrolase [Candidatus Diapherotrites archaeon]|uniref:Bifunctional protein FolD n=1 Tax=Candidatus Iainarchaeum sp. TaxID=3101447 RepID=A0A939C6I8_9ARCH|nr:bifunctional 5,10-methylenetetrahydrofolate dehydrogenase/5,10-methenyltetrahydrofolate cyclohydrolase [Candidatus Diapherotrites archaeon]
MPGKLIDGIEQASKITESVKNEVSLLQKQGIKPRLAVVLAGENAASKLYVEKKRQACEKAGVAFELVKFPETVKEEVVLEAIIKLNKDAQVNAILVQLPLPKGISQERVLNEVFPLKDVDGFTSANLGMLAYGNEQLVACTAKGIVKLIESTGTKIEGKNACIVNHSVVVGKPLSLMLLNRNATVTVCHEFTKDLAFQTRQADILVTAVGKPGLVKAGMVKKGAIVIDAGIAKKDGKTLGDADFEAVKKDASFITPVPGGVGPMTVACLLENTVLAAKLQRKG